MQDEISRVHRRTRLFGTLAMASAVAVVVMHVLELSEAFGKAKVLLAGLASTGFFLLLYVATAPLCRDCKLHFWTMFARSQVCCFMEKAALKNQMLKSARFVGWFFMGVGALALFQPRFATAHARFGDMVEARLSSPETRRARAALERAEGRYRSHPEDPDAAQAYAYLLMRARRYAAALEVLEAALERSPGDLDLRTMVGVVAAPLGKTEREIEVWRKILAEREQDVEALHNLGMVLLRHGRLDEAEVELRRAVDQAVDDLVRFKQRHKINRSTVDTLSEALVNQLEAHKYRAGAAAYQLALVAALREDPEREQHLKLARNLGYETKNFDRDVAALKKS